MRNWKKSCPNYRVYNTYKTILWLWASHMRLMYDNKTSTLLIIKDLQYFSVCVPAPWRVCIWQRCTAPSSSQSLCVCPERSRSLSSERHRVTQRDMTRMDPSPHRGAHSSWMDERSGRDRSRRGSGQFQIYTAPQSYKYDTKWSFNFLCYLKAKQIFYIRFVLMLSYISAVLRGLYDFQSQEESGNTRVTTSLQTDGRMLSIRWTTSPRSSFVTMRGDIPSPATMFLSPKLPSPTGMSVWASPPSGGTRRPIRRILGEANPHRGTHTTPTSDGGPTHRGLLQHVTALWVRIDTS